MNLKNTSLTPHPAEGQDEHCNHTSEGATKIPFDITIDEFALKAVRITTPIERAIAEIKNYWWLFR